MPNEGRNVTKGWSAHATRYPDLRKDKPRTDPVFGLCIHTSGSGILKKAKKTGKHPDLVALTYYQTATYSTHYVVGLNGFYQLTSELERVQHVGMADEKRKRSPAQTRKWYLSGRWREDLPKAFVQRWDRRWTERSPSHLYPSKFPNSCYVAVECIPCDGFAAPHGKGRYTDAQHVWCAVLACDLAERHRWPQGWEASSRLAGHEDLAPHNRITKSEGWDPGGLREEPWFDWDFFYAWVNQGQTLFRGRLDIMADIARRMQ